MCLRYAWHGTAGSVRPFDTQSCLTLTLGQRKGYLGGSQYRVASTLPERIASSRAHRSFEPTSSLLHIPYGRLRQRANRSTCPNGLAKVTVEVCRLSNLTFLGNAQPLIDVSSNRAGLSQPMWLCRTKLWLDLAFQHGTAFR